MAEERAALRMPAVASRRPAAASRIHPVAATARPMPAARALQQRLGNQGAQVLAAQMVARSSPTGAATAITIGGAQPTMSGGASSASSDARPTVSDSPTPGLAPPGTLQAKITVSQPRDPLEREADSVADKVMRMPDPSAKPRNGLPTTSVWSGVVVQRACAACDEQGAHPGRIEGEAVSGAKVQRKEEGTAEAQVTPAVAADIGALQGKGSPLPEQARTFFEPRFGSDFSQVRVHTDTQAARTANSINAKAFTIGRDIAFGAGQFSPESQAGRHLLAHELTHVVQHGHSTARSYGAVAPVQRVPGDTPPPAAKNDPAIVAQLHDEIETWGGNANQDGDMMLRAKATRMVLLLQARTRPLLATQQDLDVFTNDCAKRALTELGTLGAFSPAAAEGALGLFPKGFPLTWSGRIHEALSLGVDPATILKTNIEATTKLLQRAVALGPELATKGLPVPYEHLERLNDFNLRVGDATSEQSSPVRDYAIEGIRYTQLKWLLAFAFAWEGLVNNLAEAVADGERVPLQRDYDNFVKNKQAILRDLPARAADRIARSDEELEKMQSDAQGLADAALLVGMVSGLASLFAILGGWNEVTAGFKGALAKGDSGVAGEGSAVHLGRALKWAWYNDYYSGAAAATGREMWEGAPEALEETAKYILLGMIPVIDIGVAVYLFFKLGVDVVEMLAELTSAISDVTGAKTVVDLQKAAARLAKILMRAGIFVSILAATWGIGRAIGKLRAAKAKAKGANPSLSEEQATRKAMRELSKEEREALDSSKVKTARSVNEKFAEFAGACRLGSILCDSIPASIRKEMGPPPPTKYNVPPPKGSFNIQKAEFAAANRSPPFLRIQVLTDSGRWPHLVKAMKENGGKWPVDENGVPWQVHHIKPAGMGGGSEIDNLFPLPASDHSILTNYWNAVRHAFEKRFTKAEWDAIYGKSTKDVSGADVPKAQLPNDQR